MMRSLYSGVSGLKAHQTKMDVIGNNIANVNTVGFKSSTVKFSDVLYQTTQSATGPNATTGTTGSNAIQIGLGTNVSSITTSISQTGGAQTTGDALDMMINGDAFFIVNSGGTNYFTKAGSFTVDANGTLCTYTGAAVMGWQVNPDNPNEIVQDKVSALQVMSADKMFSAPEATTNAYVTGNIDSKDTTLSSGKTILTSFYDSMGNTYSLKMTLKQTDVSSEYTISVKDLVDENNESLFVKKVTVPGVGGADDTEEYVATGYTVTIGGQEFKVKDVDPVTGEFTFEDGAVDLKFNGSTGKFVSVGDDPDNTTSVAFSVNTNGEPNPFTTIDIDFSTLTMYSNSGNSSIESYMGDTSGNGTGKQVGEMTGISVDTSGKIYGKYNNGDSKLLGQIAVASFANPAGLEAVGDNLYAATQNSGEFNGIGEDPSSNGGSLSTGVLEMSNVDLSTEFTNMITTQRGFQANSRIITTSDTLLEELISLKR